MLKKYLRPKEAANQLGISQRTLYRLARAGVLPSVKIGPRRVVFPEDRLQNVMTRLERETRKQRGDNAESA